MAEENEVHEVEETPTDPEVAVEEGEESTDWKAEASKWARMAKANKKKLEKLEKAEVKLEKPKEEAAKTGESKPTDLTDGQKALFVAYGIKAKAEIALGKEIMAKLNISNVDDLVEDDYFQSRLTKLRNEIALKDAVPANTGRSATAQGNKLDYWLAKYQSSGNLAEVPKELQRDVLNARLKAEEQKTKFG